MKLVTILLHRNTLKNTCRIDTRRCPGRNELDAIHFLRNIKSLASLMIHNNMCLVSMIHCAFTWYRGYMIFISSISLIHNIIVSGDHPLTIIFMSGIHWQYLCLVSMIHSNNALIVSMMHNIWVWYIYNAQYMSLVSIIHNVWV